MGIPSTHPLKWRPFQRLPETHFMSTFHSGTNSDGRHSWHSCFLPVNTSWVLKVAFDFCSDFLWQQPHASNESSAHCLSGLLRLSCATLYANPHNRRLELGDTCEPHAHSCSLYLPLFFCLFSDHSYTIGFSFYVITFLVKNHWIFPNICFWPCGESSLALVHTNATPTRTVHHTQHSSEVGPHVSHSTSAHFLETESLLAPLLWQIPCIPVGLNHPGVNGRLERNRLTCTYNNGAEGIVVNHWLLI